MLLAVAFLLLSFALGLAIIERTRFFDSVLENFALGIPIGIAISSFIVLGFDALAGGFSDSVFYMSLLVMLLAIIVLYRRELLSGRLRIRKLKPTSVPKSVLYIILLIFGIIAFVLLTSVYMSNGTLYCIGPSLCSDLFYHMGTGNSVIYSGFPPKWLFTTNAINVFPFINDLYSALLINYGLGLVPSVIIPYLVLFFSAVTLTTEFAYFVLKNRFATLASMLVFWFGSDFIMAFIAYPLSSALPGIPNNLPPLASILANYHSSATGFGALLATSSFIISGWTSILYQNLFPQRGFVLALPLGIALLFFAYQFLFAKKRFTKAQLLLIGVIVGLMPLIHPITLLIFAFVGVYVFLKLLLDKERRREIAAIALYVVLPALILALPQVIFMTSQPPVPGRYHFVYQYFYTTGHGFVSDLLTNLVQVPFFWIDLVGLPIFMAIAGYVLAGKNMRSFFLPFLSIWIFVTIFSFELDGSDANKLFMYVFFSMCILSGYLFSRLYRKGVAWKAFAVVLVLANVLNFAAIYGYWASLTLPWISPAEFNASEFALHNTSANSIFAVSDYSSLQQPISSLGGRQTLLSMYPYVEIDEYTHPLSQLISDNSQIFSTGNCTLLRSLNISYVYLLSNSSNSTTPFLNQNFVQVFTQPDQLRGATIFIYKVLC